MKIENKNAGRGGSVEKDGDKWLPAIFWQFIRKDRNLLLHEARLNAGQGVMCFPGADREAEYSYIIHTGYFKGRDQRDVVLEAIEWWEETIRGIERKVASIPNRP